MKKIINTALILFFIFWIITFVRLVNSYMYFLNNHLEDFNPLPTILFFTSTISLFIVSKIVDKISEKKDKE